MKIYTLDFPSLNTDQLQKLIDYFKRTEELNYTGTFRSSDIISILDIKMFLSEEYNYIMKYIYDNLTYLLSFTNNLFTFAQQKYNKISNDLNNIIHKSILLENSLKSNLLYSNYVSNVHVINFVDTTFIDLKSISGIAIIPGNHVELDTTSCTNIQLSYVVEQNEHCDVYTDLGIINDCDIIIPDGINVIFNGNNVFNNIINYIEIQNSSPSIIKLTSDDLYKNGIIEQRNISIKNYYYHNTNDIKNSIQFISGIINIDKYIEYYDTKVNSKYLIASYLYPLIFNMNIGSKKYCQEGSFKTVNFSFKKEIKSIDFSYNRNVKNVNFDDIFIDVYVKNYMTDEYYKLSISGNGVYELSSVLYSGIINSDNIEMYYIIKNNTPVLNMPYPIHSNLALTYNNISGIANTVVYYDKYIYIDDNVIKEILSNNEASIEFSYYTYPYIQYYIGIKFTNNNNIYYTPFINDIKIVGNYASSDAIITNVSNYRKTERYNYKNIDKIL